MEIRENVILLFIFFQVFVYDFFIYKLILPHGSFKHSNWWRYNVTHKTFNINWNFCFTLKFHEKSSLIYMFFSTI